MHVKMFLRSLTLATMLTTGGLIAQSPPSPTTLEALHDHYRPLLVFAANPSDPALLTQLRLLKDSAPGLARRDVLVIAIPYDTPSPLDPSLTPEAVVAARRRFHAAPPDFIVILLGKDGGEKLRSTKPVSFNKLQDKIDSMPMRQQEMADPARR